MPRANPKSRTEASVDPLEEIVEAEDEGVGAGAADSGIADG
jgi:hypothetical protein